MSHSPASGGRNKLLADTHPHPPPNVSILRQKQNLIGWVSMGGVLQLTAGLGPRWERGGGVPDLRESREWGSEFNSG